MSMRGLRMFFMSVDTKKRAEEESRHWLAPCRHCGAAVSAWDAGQLRYNTEDRKTVEVKCPKCQAKGPFTFTKTK